MAQRKMETFNCPILLNQDLRGPEAEDVPPVARLHQRCAVGGFLAPLWLLRARPPRARLASAVFQNCVRPRRQRKASQERPATLRKYVESACVE